MTPLVCALLTSESEELKKAVAYAAPIGAFFCPEIRAFTARFLQPFPKSLAPVKYYPNTKMAVNSR